MTYEPTTEEKEQMEKVFLKIAAELRRRQERRRALASARREGTAPPPHTPYRFFLPNTTAHSILRRLSEKGPAVRQELIEELQQSETSINGQILRLLDYGLVDRDHFAVYNITDEGEKAFEQLSVGMSHTRWLR